jgi:hypothetical protein
MADACDLCGRPLATDADEQVTAPGEGEDLCWRAYQGGVCTGEPVDWRARYLVEADARVASEGACEYAESECEVLREQLAAAREEIATLRVALGTLPAVQVLSPLAVYPVAVAVGEPYPVCARCQRLAADCSCQPPLICPACQCAWPELTTGHEDTVTCACGRVLGCTRRGR